MPKTTELSDQEYVESIVKPIVDKPDEVVTTRSLDERGVLIQLTVNQEDMGKVIGREGRTAKSIRSLLRVFGARSDSRINLKIVEPDGGEVKIGTDAEPLPIPAMDEQPIPAIEEKPADNDKTEQTMSVI